MDKFHLNFKLGSYNQLDELALLACQKYNLGNDSKWFDTFRGGLYGFYNRIYGVDKHYYLVHAWLPTPRSPYETEYHISSIFFNMDSALECLTFALNSLGFATSGDSFRDVTSTAALRQISPTDIIGEKGSHRTHQSIPGYQQIYPTLQSYWQDNSKLLTTIMEQHDVSKHRESIYDGGMSRLEPPKGFYEALGIDENSPERSNYWPMAEIIIRAEPKKVKIDLQPQTSDNNLLLENLADDFVHFITTTGEKALNDAVQNIDLTHNRLLRNDE